MIASDRATSAGLVREGLSEEVTTAVTAGNGKDPAGQRTGGGCASAKALGWVFEGEGEAVCLEGTRPGGCWVTPLRAPSVGHRGLEVRLVAVCNHWNF